MLRRSPTHRVWRSVTILTTVMLWLGLAMTWQTAALLAQEPASTSGPATASPRPPGEVRVRPVAPDDDIAQRLADILAATDRYVSPRVGVEDGVVFLDGQARTRSASDWAEALAANTEDVVAVVNRMELTPGPLLDFEPAWSEVNALWRDTLGALPLIAVVLVILLVTGVLAFLTLRIGRHFLRPRMPSVMLANVTVWLIAAPVVLVGIYVALRVAGLTQLALTVLGGTGLAGLIIGIAFRDIAENFLASILLSVRNPFRAGDRIELAGYLGIVQRITTRGTILMTLDGNHVQIPNSTVYKSTITNYTANPTRRMDFAVGIGYDATIAQAQAALDTVLREHPVVLDDPEPLVLVEDLGSATVNLRAYFWFNGTQYEGLKLKSALIRLAKRALEMEGISMPDEAREVIFPQGVPIVGPAAPTGESTPPEPNPASAVARPVESDATSTDSEGGLRSENASIQHQADQARLPEDGDDLLDPRD